MCETYVIVHLSSLDSYTAFYGIEAAQVFMNDLRLSILTHSGPVVILDQQWEELSEDAKMLRTMVQEMGTFHPDMTTLHHDELCDIDPWHAGVDAIARVLRRKGNQRIRLGGLWASQNGKTVCVHAMATQLRTRGFRCRIDPSVCAYETADRRASHGG